MQAVTGWLAATALVSCGAFSARTVVTPPPRTARTVDDYDALRGPFDREKLLAFFAKRPQVVASRLAKVTRTFRACRSEWESQNDVPFEQRTRSDALREACSSLGPVSVKLGQTLSQRADLIGDEAADALKSLQTQNTPFSDEVAWATLAVELETEPDLIAPNLPNARAGVATSGFALAELSRSPVAVASLGQVYKGRTHGGVEVAVKVQRPDAVKVCALDFACFALTWKAVEIYWKWRSDFDNGDIGEVVDTVATGVFEELDYRLEAHNAALFKESLGFLGFVTVPRMLEELTTEQVLTTEWVNGAHLSALSKGEGARMTQMAVEACTASLVLTGFVHADPHEGNLMLDSEGRIVFMDFGLMSRVDDSVMESFASGIRACLAEDYETLAECFTAVGFLTVPLQWRPKVGAPYETLEYEEGLARFSSDLAEAMGSVDGGKSRFGALAVVLSQILGPNWKMFSPPYVILLIRTFLTLEGIAARVDPDFNIYAIALPWALRRSLTPTSEKGVQTLRRALLTDDNRVRWDELLETVNTHAATQDSLSWDAPPAECETDSSPTLLAQSTALDEDDASPAAPGLGACFDEDDALSVAITSVFGSTQGLALRKALADVDSTDLASKMISKEGRPLRRLAALQLSGLLDKSLTKLLSRNSRKPQVLPATEGAVATGGAVTRPVSAAARDLRRRQSRWQRKAYGVLLRIHLRRQTARGWRGAVSVFSVLFVSLRVLIGAVACYLRLLAGRLLPRRARPGGGLSALA